MGGWQLQALCAAGLEQFSPHRSRQSKDPGRATAWTDFSRSPRSRTALAPSSS